MHGVILDGDSLGPDLDLSRLRETLQRWTVHAATPAGETAARIRDADVVVSNKVLVGATEIARAPSLKLICVAATGTNNVDLQAARARAIPVCNVRGYGTPSVVEHVFALMLTLRRSLDAHRAGVKAGDWTASPFFCLFPAPIGELSGATLGIVGYGELGRGVARIAEAFGMRVLVAARPGSTTAPEGRVLLEEMLPQLDVLTLHCPLTPETEHLIGARELALMPSHAIVINTARGGIVDETALVEALKGGVIGGAGMDVLRVEPPPAGQVLLQPGIPNLVVTPHVAWAGQQSRQRLIDQVADNIRAYLDGAPRNLV